MTEPTPPAAPRISSVPVDSRVSLSRSNRDSQAVIEVSGSAAASAKLSVPGRSATIRSSTACSSALAPGRLMSPA